MAVKLILHITTRDDWEQARAGGAYYAPSLGTEGFIHCSTTKQIVDVAEKYYRGRRDLVLLCIDRKKVQSPVRYEPPHGQESTVNETVELYPHIYGPLNTDAVIKVIDFTPGQDGRFALPPLEF